MSGFKPSGVSGGDLVRIVKEWNDRKNIERLRDANLDWIFSNGQEVLKGASEETVLALAKCLGYENRGLNRNSELRFAKKILSIAKKYLMTNDKEGWLLFCSLRKRFFVDYLTK
ncbi:MAG: hypothetical protein RIR39_1967 [Pseudomonadota bacterium]|jgi:hypothetical protein